MTIVVLDTTTLISALGWKHGNPRKVFDLCVHDKYKLIESLDLIKEFILVINRPKFDFISVEYKNEFLLSFLQICDLVEPKEKLKVVKPDPKDDIVLECALAGKSNYIISGDKHLLDLKDFRGIKILTPKDFLSLIDKE